MPYIGKQLSNGNYLKLDDISSSFDSSTTTFSLTNGGSAYYPGSEFSILVSVGGVIQEPESAYQINNDQITFANAPTAQDSFFCVVLGDAIGINVPGNNTVNGAQMAKPFNYDGGLLYLDDTDNRVGINSTSPQAALDVVGDVKISGVLNPNDLSTFYNLRVSNNLTVEGTTSTLDTDLIGVDRVEVGANSNTVVGVAITQSGTADILRLYDGTSQVVAVDDEGKIGIGEATPRHHLTVKSGGTNVAIAVSSTDSGSYISYQDNTTGDTGTNSEVYAGALGGAFAVHTDAQATPRLSIENNGEITQTAASGNTVITLKRSNTNTVGTVGGINFAALDGHSVASIQARGDGNDEGAHIQFYTTSAAAGDMYNAATVERLRITSLGKVGIGSAIPSNHLDVAGGANVLGIYRNDYTGTGGAGLNLNFGGAKASGELFNCAKITAVRGDNTGQAGEFRFSVLTAGSMSEKLRITSAGKIGIGTDNPTYKLHVDSGDAAIGLWKSRRSSGSYIEYAVGANGAALGYIGAGGQILTGGADSGDFAIRSQGDLCFSSGGAAEKLRITSTGAVGINSTTPTANYKLDVNGDLTLGEWKGVSNTFIDQKQDGDLHLINSGRTAQGASGSPGTAGVGINRFNNISGGTSLFRDFCVYNGKDSKVLVVDGSTSKVGIGTDLPDYGLHVFGAGDILIEDSGNGSAHLRLRSSNNGTDVSNWKIKTSSDNKFYIENDTIGGASRFVIDSTGNITATGSTHNLFRSDSYNVLELRADENNDGGNDDVIFKFTHDGTFRSEMRYDESSSTLEISTADNRDDFSMDTDGKVTFAQEIATPQDYPTIRPTLDLNFAAVKKLDPAFTFERTGPGSYIDERGYVRIVGANIPRFDHDPVTKECKGLLVEQNIPNWIKYSSDLSGTGWGTNNVTHTLAPSVVGPDGKTGGVYESKENSSSAYHASHYQSSIPVTNNQYYSVSSWVKKGPNYRTDINGGNYQFYCSRGTGSVASMSIDSTFTSISAHTNTTSRSITQYPNGWVKVTYSFQSNQNASNVIPHWLHGNGGQYSGNGASSVYIWGCQFESLPFPSSYIPTNKGTVVYRGEDNVVISGTEFSDFYNSSEGTSVVHTHMPVSNGNSGLPSYAFKNSAVGSHTLQFSRDSGSGPAYHYYHDGSNTAFTRATLTSDNMYKAAMSFKSSDLDSYVNGSINVNTTTFTLPAFDSLRIGGISGANMLGGHIARFMYYPAKLPNSQLITLTS